MQLAWICVGGALGSGARYLVSMWVLRHFGSGFPYGTLAVNVVGSFLLGLVMQHGLSTEWPKPALRACLTAGVLGGFTTYSTFSYESLRLFQSGASWTAGAYVVATLVGGWTGALLGIAAGKWIAA